MKLLSLTIIISLLAAPASTLAQRPTRRAILQQGEQILEQAKQVKLHNQATIGTITYEEKIIPLLGITFEKPAPSAKGIQSWDVSNIHDNTSSYSNYKISDGDYIVLSDEQHEETYAIFIYAKNFDELTTIDTVREEWERQLRQPDHDNVYEYSNLGFIRELNVIRADDYEYMGKPALYIEYTFSNWSKFWHGTAVMFPHGKKVYTIKYRRERDLEDKLFHVYQHVIDTFRFLTKEPSYSSFKDVSANHRNARAIERLQSLKIVGGYEDGSFKPEANINRAEFVKILTSEPLVSATDLATCDTSSLQFSDVPTDAWYTPHLCVAVDRGMIGGYPDGAFRGSNQILFVEAAKIVATFFAEEELTPNEGTWFAPFVHFLATRKAIPTTISAATSPLTRAMMSEILYRLYDNVETEDSKTAQDFE